MNRREFIGAAAALPLFGPSGGPSDKLTVPFLAVDCPNDNGHIYSRKAIEKAIGELSVIGLPGFIDMSLPHSVNDASHVVDGFKLVGNVLVADVKIIDSPNGRRLRTILPKVAFRSAMLVELDENWHDPTGLLHIQSGCLLVEVNAVLKNQASKWSGMDW